jgi:hypothetical protein
MMNWNRLCYNKFHFLFIFILNNGPNFWRGFNFNKYVNNNYFEQTNSWLNKTKYKKPWGVPFLLYLFDKKREMTVRSQLAGSTVLHEQNLTTLKLENKPIPKKPFLFRYRSNNRFVFCTASFALFTSVSLSLSSESEFNPSFFFSCE